MINLWERYTVVFDDNRTVSGYISDIQVGTMFGLLDDAGAFHVIHWGKWKEIVSDAGLDDSGGGYGDFGSPDDPRYALVRVMPGDTDDDEEDEDEEDVA